MESTLILTTPDQLSTIINAAVSDALSRILPIAAPAPAETTDKLYSRKQTAERLCITLATLHTWTMGAKIKASRIGSRVLYKESDIQAALKAINVTNIAA